MRRGVSEMLFSVLLCFSILEIACASDGFFGPTDSDGLVDLSDACACPGSSVQYYCTVNDPSGISTTRWRGSAFICTGNDASLFHSDYMSGLAADPCTDGGFNLIARGLTNITDNCYTSVLSVVIVPGLSGRTVECTSAGTRIIGNDTLQVSVPLPPPSSPVVEQVLPDQSFTVSWSPPPNDCGNTVNYTYLTSPDGSCGECTNIMTSQVSTTCTGWTAVEGQSCSISARADNCGGEGNVSEPVIISFPRPAAPTITGGEVVFDQSRNISTVTLEWEPVEPTAAIAMSAGVVLLNGTITSYLVAYASGLPDLVECNDPTCSSSESRSDNGAGLFISVRAINNITQGTADQALCPNFQVSRIIESSLLDVTLVCPTEAVGGCTIRYGVDPSYQTLPFEGRSGEPLQNLTAGQTYYTEAIFSLNCDPVFTFTVRDRFNTCECPPSGLFPGATLDPADTCPPEYTGGVRINERGRACYNGLTGGSTAVFLCDTSSANCSGSCEAVCNCSTGTTEGLWSASFREVDCFTGPTPGGLLNTPETTGVVIGAVLGLISALAVLFVVTVAVPVVYYKKKRTAKYNLNKQQHSTIELKKRETVEGSQTPLSAPAGGPPPPPKKEETEYSSQSQTGVTGESPSEDVAYSLPSDMTEGQESHPPMDLWVFLLYFGLALIIPGFGIIIAVILLILRCCGRL